MMKLVIGLSGRIGSGKTIVSDFLQKKYKADQMRYSSILADVLDRLYLPKDRSNLQTLGEVLRKCFGSGVIVDAFRKDLEKSRSEVVVIDGIRYMNEVEMLRSFKKNVLIYVDAPDDLRYKRSVKRAEKGEGGISFKQFLDSEKRETEKHLGDVKKSADYVVDNSGTTEELYEKIDEIIRQNLK